MLGDIPQTWDEIWELGPGVYSWVQSIPLEWQPEGFRGVSGYCAVLAVDVEGGNIVGAAQAWCDTEGIIRTLCPSGTYRIRGEIVFCAN